MQLMVRLQNQLQSKLQQFPTQQDTIDLIDNLLFSSSWNLPPQEQTNPVTQQLLQAQLHLPLCEFSKGRLVHAWSQHQDEYLKQIQSQWTASKWTQTLINELWNIFFQMWLHRNEAYHSNEQVQNTIQQLQQIDNEIPRQWTIGTQGLDNTDKLHFRNQTLAQLLRNHDIISKHGYSEYNWQEHPSMSLRKALPIHQYPQVRMIQQHITPQQNKYTIRGLYIG